MKKELLIVLLSILTTVSFSQDVLLFQDGSKKDAKILEISPETVKYKKHNSSSDVVYTEDKYNLIGVVFEDGEFEKFEGRKNTFSKNMSSKLGEYGSNMFTLNPLAPIAGYIILGYEHFSKSGKSSVKIPLMIDLTDGNGSGGLFSSRYSRVHLKTGYEQKFFPTGSDGHVKGFIGFSETLGLASVLYYYTSYDYYTDDYYYYEGYDTGFFNDTQFIGGVQFHPSELINITLDAGLGMLIYEFDEIFLSYKLGLNVGFRF
jgi:hypothetical protein